MGTGVGGGLDYALIAWGLGRGGPTSFLRRVVREEKPVAVAPP
jgi:hypothetical protein